MKHQFSAPKSLSVQIFELISTLKERLYTQVAFSIKPGSTRGWRGEGEACVAEARL